MSKSKPAASSFDVEEWARDPFLVEAHAASHFKSHAERKPVPLAPLPSDGRPHLHLVIGDSHAHPDHSNERFTWLGRMVADLRPDVVVDIGDWYDMDSLNKYDGHGGKTFAGKRYWRDIDAGRAAQELFQLPLDELNRGARRHYNPHKVRTLGNHEFRIQRCVEQESAYLDGVIGLHHLWSAHYGWHEHPFLASAVVDGLTYRHYFTSGSRGHPIGGDYPAAGILRRYLSSCIAGHDHKFDLARRSRPDGSKVLAIVAGCYFDYEAKWAGPDNARWDRGILLLHGVRGGMGDPEWWSMDRVKAKYA